MRLLSYLGSAFLVTIWTLLRFFNRQTIFDLVGQQVLAGQWLHGHSSGANIGVTNYILKMLFLYMPLDALPGSARLKLIILTIAVNITTIVLLGILLEKILREFKIRPGALFYGGLLWLSAIAGSVFWIQFTNSRNLEVVGGVFLLYLGLRYLRRPSWKLLAGITAFGGVLFFADTLQFFMTAVPLVLYAAIQSGRKRRAYMTTAKLTAGLVIGFVLSKMLFLVAGKVFSLTYLQAQGTTSLSAAALGHGAINTIHALAQLFSGAADAGTVRMGLNVLIFTLGLVAFAYAVWRKTISHTFALLVGCVVVTNCAVYVLSGQARQDDTSRYLIMLAPIVVLAFGSLDRHPNGKGKRIATSALFATVIVNAFFLGMALVRNWDTSFPKDAHLSSVSRYLADNPSARAYASMDTSLPLTYFDDPHAPLPLSCGPDGLIKNRTFYDQGAFAAQENRPSTTTLVFLDTDAIRNAPNICSVVSVTKQLGQPQSTDTTDDGSIVLRYRSDSVSLPTAFN